MRVACLQMCSGLDRDTNRTTVARLLASAAQQGAELAVLPETFVFMGGSETEKRAMAEHQFDSPTLDFLAKQAAHHQMAIVGGTLLLNTAADGGRDPSLRNACPAFDATGSLLAVYDKIHLFDMDYQGESYHESALMKAGDTPVSVACGGFKVGLSVCYDLRFPELYRIYSDEGCDILCNVAAFTATTGRAHWLPLLQARAIENQCYVLASAQSGTHPDGRQTWGHSMIIDPWGEVLSELASGEGIVLADVSKAHVKDLRQSLPVLQHRRL